MSREDDVRKMVTGFGKLTEDMDVNTVDAAISMIVATHATSISVQTDHTVQTVIQQVSDTAIEIAMDMKDEFEKHMKEMAA